MIQHLRAEADRGPHGQPMSEVMDPRGSRATDGGWHYEASENGVTDNAELAINEARDAYLAKWGDRLTDAQKAAKHWTVRKVMDE